MAAVALGDGNAMNNIGDAALASIIEQQKQKIEGMEESKTLLVDQINGSEGSDFSTQIATR